MSEKKNSQGFNSDLRYTPHLVPAYANHSEAGAGADLMGGGGHPPWPPPLPPFVAQIFLANATSNKYIMSAECRSAPPPRPPSYKNPVSAPGHVPLTPPKPCLWPPPPTTDAIPTPATIPPLIPIFTSFSLPSIPASNIHPELEFHL